MLKIIWEIKKKKKVFKEKSFYIKNNIILYIYYKNWA